MNKREREKGGGNIQNDLIDFDNKPVLFFSLKLISLVNYKVVWNFCLDFFFTFLIVYIYVAFKSNLALLLLLLVACYKKRVKLMLF